MSRKNVELVHRLYRAMDSRDVKTIEELADADAE
jgi:ketosteroid isomerase-like protein